MGAFGTAFTLATRINVLPMVIYTEFTLKANIAVAAALVVRARRRHVGGARRSPAPPPAAPSRPRAEEGESAQPRPALLRPACLHAAGLRVPDRAGRSCPCWPGLTVNYLVGIQSGLTLRWVGEVWSGYRDTIFLSIGIALACLACTLVLGIPTAYVLAKRQTALARALEELLVMPVAVPGLATALALIITYGGSGGFRTSWAFILVGPRALHAALHGALGAGRADGDRPEDAGGGRRVARRRLPPALLPHRAAQLPRRRAGGSLMVVTLSMGEFNMTWLLHTPFNKTLPVGLADAYASLRLEIASAYTLVFFLMIVPLLLADAVAVASARGDVPRGRGVSAIPAAAKPIADRAGALRQDVRRRHARARAARPDDRRRRDGGVPRAVRLRQDHHACASSPASRRPTPAAACCSTATDVTPLADREAQRRHGVPVATRCSRT